MNSRPCLHLACFWLTRHTGLWRLVCGECRESFCHSTKVQPHSLTHSLTLLSLSASPPHAAPLIAQLGDDMRKVKDDTTEVEVPKSKSLEQSPLSLSLVSENAFVDTVKLRSCLSLCHTHAQHTTSCGFPCRSCSALPACALLSNRDVASKRHPQTSMRATLR